MGRVSAPACSPPLRCRAERLAVTTSNRPNLEALGSALNIYRDVMREMIVSIPSAA